MWVIDKPVVVIRSLDIIKQILIKDITTFPDRNITYEEENNPIMANMLFFSKNPQWRYLRQKMSRMFTTLKLKDMIFLMNKNGDDMLHHMQEATCEVYDLKDVSMKYTVDAITSIGFSINAMCFEKDDSKFNSVAGDLFSPTQENYARFISHFLMPRISNWLQVTFFNLKHLEFLKTAAWDIINKRIKYSAKGNDLISMYIDWMKLESSNGYKFEGDRVSSQAVQLFVAGFETISSTIAFTLYEISFNQTIQDKLREEIQSKYLFGTEVTYELIKDLTYLDQVISETLRKYPVLPFLDRRCNSDFKIPNSDYVIENGISVYISIFGLHYDPEYFPNPHVYDPERFSPENIKSINLDAYIPFGIGPRNCVGKRLGLNGTKICLIKLLSEYKVETCPETAKNIDFHPMSFTIAPKIGLKLKFTKAEGAGRRSERDGDAEDDIPLTLPPQPIRISDLGSASQIKQLLH
ncbi:PREDICTED: probable cytochrome P450 6w1 [Nicrophorus vespilloides]|uniref:Probable cytochrome P450 6w1 n=1 Tax=Nicrophorus vespilloides TaxID=110193 RepID=A0ABM1NEH0_NICVS|nr:PREDICTED: probable cytochrome P450 6w1 [Nicrophorus vespilloides]